jgi:hypothetical protein
MKMMQTIAEIRRHNLKLLISEYGSAKALADALDKQPAQLSQWVNASPDSKTGVPRGLRDNTAREIERSTGKPKGWMDTPPQGVNDNRRLQHNPPTTLSHSVAALMQQIALMEAAGELDEAKIKILSDLLAVFRGG